MRFYFDHFSLPDKTCLKMANSFKGQVRSAQSSVNYTYQWRLACTWANWDLHAAWSLSILVFGYIAHGAKNLFLSFFKTHTKELFLIIHLGPCIHSCKGGGGQLWFDSLWNTLCTNIHTHWHSSSVFWKVKCSFWW